jgi:hypothetical protein
VTSSGIEAHNRTSNFTPDAESYYVFFYDTDDNQWHIFNAPEEAATVTPPGFIATPASGQAVARIFQDTNDLTWTNGNGANGNPSAAINYSTAQKASTAQPGFCTEMATAAEVNTGADAVRCASPDAIAGSTYGTIFVTLWAVAPGAALDTGDGGDYWTVPPELNGWNLVSVFGAVYTASSSGTPTFQVYNVTQTTDMLSTALTIDASELNSSTAATPALIDTANDDVATGDIIRLDRDAAGTGTQGGDVILGFRLP